MRGSFRIAVEEVSQHPIRTLLVSQGMLWAVAVIVIPAAVIEGSREAAVERARELGTDRIEVSTDSSQGDGAIPVEGDLAALRAALPPETAVTALRAARAAFAERDLATVWLLGSDAALPAARGVEILEGTFPTWERRSPEAGEPIPVAIERHLAERLFPEAAGGTAGPLGAEFHLEVGEDGRAGRLSASAPAGSSLRLRIVAVVSDQTQRHVDRFGYEKGRLFAEDIAKLARMFGVMAPNTPWLESGLGIYLPRELMPGDRIDWLYVRTDPRRVEAASRAIEEVLTRLGRAPLVFNNTLWAIMTKPELDGYLALHDALSRVFLVIGLMVLANLLLLSGWRRRWEVALRRAEGASRLDIFLQFLGEGIAIGAVGLVGGIVAGMLLAWLRVALDPNVAMALGWPWGTIIESSVILFVGVLLASVYPAWRASGHEPMTLFREGR